MLELKGRYKLIAFSGNIPSRIQYLENKYSFKKWFDVEVYSFDYGETKPSKKFVEVMLEKAGLKGEGNKVLYVDDKEKDAAPARELGVNIFIYERGNVSELRKKMRELGVDVQIK
eukprot:TRINITY_DN8296_c0_g3_i1.p1 TRINITY_DN8296_c0_g3~~TRINITY_DN8296_c0_g3_i1.p1  ORF type:complete len:115 (+),score=23.75 TRINITY_DN8296_c0_g3_i1:704-1048(+)